MKYFLLVLAACALLLLLVLMPSREDGQVVKKGDVLATLKQAAEQASLKEQQAVLTDAQREVRRLENLARKTRWHRPSWINRAPSLRSPAIKLK